MKHYILAILLLFPIDNIEYVNTNSSEQEHISAIYSVDGQKQEQLTKGINIIVLENGDCHKVLK